MNTPPSDSGSGSGQPVVRIAGHPSDVEVAVVIAVLGLLDAAAPGRSPHEHQRRSLWNSRGRAARPRLAPGPGAWAGSVLPR
ncbi:MAG: acyl-CoA carboxylase subunit epsilon [Ornithinimicrobium sp.]